MTKTILLMAIGIGALVFTAESNLDSQKNDFVNSSVSEPMRARAAYHYLMFRRLLIKNRNAEYSIATAFHVARQPVMEDFPTLMKHGGLALSLLAPIAESVEVEDKPWKAQAAYEALLLLVRMPLDSALFQLSDRFAKVLFDTLKVEENAANAAEVFQAKEVLSMYAARKRGEAKMLEGMLTLPIENIKWLNDLATVRIGLSACAQRNTVAPPPSWDALARGFGRKWLSVEAKMGWDAALTQTVNLSNVSEDCKKLAQRYESMINLTTGE